MKHDFEKYKEAIDDSLTMAQAAIKLGLHFGTFKLHAKKFGLYKPNMGGRGTKKSWGSWKYVPLNEILDGKHPSFGTFKLKQKLLKEGIIENKCSLCSVSSWNGKELRCELDHINGIRYDHRWSNLRMLCPNCHSQTDTYRAKNKNGRVVKWHTQDT